MARREKIQTLLNNTQSQSDGIDDDIKKRFQSLLKHLSHVLKNKASHKNVGTQSHASIEACAPDSEHNYLPSFVKREVIGVRSISCESIAIHYKDKQTDKYGVAIVGHE